MLWAIQIRIWCVRPSDDRSFVSFVRSLRPSVTHLGMLCNLGTVKAGVLIFHRWIDNKKLVNPYFFSFPSAMYFQSYAPFSKN